MTRRINVAGRLFLLWCIISACSDGAKTAPDGDTASDTGERAETATDTTSDTDSDSRGDTESSDKEDTDTTTSAQVQSPVKVLWILDQSASLACIDPEDGRFDAIDLAGTELDQTEEIQISAIGFASWSLSVPFGADWQPARDVLFNNKNGSASDYQGALATALRVLEQDMMTSANADLSTTRYVVLFLSDGPPAPKCIEGCDDGDTPPDSLYGVCNTTEAIPDDVYVDMYEQCPEYNQDAQLLQKIRDMLFLGDVYGVGQISFHTILIVSPTEVAEASCGESFASEIVAMREEAETLLKAMGMEGNGSFRTMDFSDGMDSITFDF